MSGVNVLGIDPGITGALAIVSPSDGIWLEPMPLKDWKIDIEELVRLLTSQAIDLRAAYIEKIFALPKSGAASMMSFGIGYGILMGILSTLGVPIVEVRPQEWHKGIHDLGSPFKDTKMRSRAAFNQFFPGVNAYRTPRSKSADIGLIEAALIAKYGFDKLN